MVILVFVKFILTLTRNTFYITLEAKLLQTVNFNIYSILNVTIYKSEVIGLVNKRTKISNPMKKQIIIMSDFGNAIFWDKNGVCMGGPDGCDEFNISKSLLSEFSEWHSNFESYKFEENSDFSWSEYHEKGMELSKKLKKELRGKVEIFYDKPFEDPNHSKNDTKLIE